MLPRVQIEHQQRDRDSQHAVAERLDPVALSQHPRGLFTREA
jgi:hypothetical protein